MSRGNITKISNGRMQETAKLEHVSFAKTIQSSAAGKVNEQSADGVIFGAPKQMKYTTEEGIDLIAGMFFDGTSNNKFNTEHSALGEGKGSYGNGATNIVRLFNYYMESGTVFRIYTEGIGTLDGEKDAVTGTGFGAGPTGVIAKVLQGCRHLADKIAEKAKGKKIKTLTLDVFGFSRGAAAARNFVYEVCKHSYTTTSAGLLSSGRVDDHDFPTTNEIMPEGGHLGKLLTEKGLKYGQIKIRFVGLYDTVSSYNKGGISVKPRFDNDVEELHLNHLFRAEKVVHLTAADEHRKFFALTSIQSAGNKGIELSFPGVHSDIGGSYVDGPEYVDDLINGGENVLVAEKQRLIEEGWYKENELVVHPYLRKLSGTRNLKKDYSYISLYFMCEFAMNFHQPLSFDRAGLEGQYKFGADQQALLTAVQQRLHDYAFSGGKPLTFVSYRQLLDQRNHGLLTNKQYSEQVMDQLNLRKLRNTQLHWSADFDGIGSTMGPNMEDGVRKRIPYAG